MMASSPIEDDAEAIAVEEMLKGIDRMSAKKEPPKVEVITPRPTKLVMTIPAENPKAATVTRVEVQENGDLKVIEASRPPTSQERAMIAHGKREILSGPDAASADGGPRPWWHWALAAGGLLGVGIAGYVVKQTYFPADDVEMEEEDEEDDGE